MTWQPSAHQIARARIVRRRKLQQAVLATLVTIVVFVAVGAAIVLSPGWDAFKGYFLSGHFAKGVFHSIAVGFWINIRMFLIAEVFILVIAVIVAVVRQSKTPWLAPARIVAVAYTDLFRGVPTLLVVTVCAVGIPALQLTGFTNDPFWLCTIALVLCYGAYVAEVIRAGILSIHPNQIASADALALSRAQAMRHVILPQAIRRVIPPLINDFLSLQKDTALVSTVGVFEALRAATDYQGYHFNGTSLFVAGAFFLVVTIPVARFGDWVMLRQIRKEQGR
ncbi:MAG: amino acid ABC transporter permease [Marmoricola sp.]